MKICIDCGHEFKPRGRQKLCDRCKDEENALQEAGEEGKLQAPDAEKVRPVDRFSGNRVVFPGQVGMRVRRGP